MTGVFRGTSVVSGLGVAVVVATGAATEFGHVAAGLVGRPPETEFERGTRKFGFLILQVVVFLVLFVFLVNALLRRDLLESFLFSVALAVGLTPELLPMIVSVTLSSGAVRMAREEGHRQAARRHRELRQHGHPLQRQDRAPSPTARSRSTAT